jgi:chemosensory pili system protein ChpA (sensor histidine kinase/response regulator)
MHSRSQKIQLAPEISFDFAEAASPAASPAPAPIEFAVKEQLAVEDELLEVFLEEARRWWSTAPQPSPP